MGIKNNAANNDAAERSQQQSAQNAFGTANKDNNNNTA